MWSKSDLVKWRWKLTANSIRYDIFTKVVYIPILFKHKNTYSQSYNEVSIMQKAHMHWAGVTFTQNACHHKTKWEIRGRGEQVCARYSLKDAALEHAVAEQKAMQEGSKRTDKGGVEDGCVCTVHVYVSGYVVCC